MPNILLSILLSTFLCILLNTFLDIWLNLSLHIFLILKYIFDLLWSIRLSIVLIAFLRILLDTFTGILFDRFLSIFFDSLPDYFLRYIFTTCSNISLNKFQSTFVRHIFLLSAGYTLRLRFSTILTSYSYRPSFCLSFFSLEIRWYEETSHPRDHTVYSSSHARGYPPYRKSTTIVSLTLKTKINR